MNKRSLRASSAGFTLLELMIVVFIIALLASILIPVVGRVRERARAADTQNMLSQLSNACTNYYQDFKAYPGPLGNNEIRNDGMDLLYAPPGATPSPQPPVFPGGFALQTGPTVNDFDMAQGTPEVRKFFTMPENLVLGLLGGLKADLSSGQATLVYDPTLVGTGPNSLNLANPKKYTAYADATNLSWRIENGKKTGRYADEVSSGIEDTIVPEFVDRFADPMPILYLRAKRGVAVTANENDNNPIVTHDERFQATPNPRAGTYDLSQIIAYTKSTSTQPPIGAGKRKVIYVDPNNVPQPTQQLPFGPYNHGLRTVNVNATMTNPPPTTPGGLGYVYPYDAFPYFRNPSLSGTQAPSGSLPPVVGTQVAREKDKFILISAGSDRTYGTNDDITTFGSVGQ